ncbi:hypothetical protein MANES_01G085550v8 [Manihot esculenta]|uniref:Uncharacterized protein n=1 Tax=Manihot esculenta TaxID=3983 RepID=A0ACB7IE43_MANES|nr:hypothetical protein MANES_01G085550v8 [Manihot esculenta]
MKETEFHTQFVISLIVSLMLASLRKSATDSASFFLPMISISKALLEVHTILVEVQFEQVLEKLRMLEDIGIF